MHSLKRDKNMRRILDYTTYLSALKQWFHQGQTPDTYYKQPPIYHSLSGRGGPRDANGNRLGNNGNVIGRDAAFYPVTNSTNPYTRNPIGAWLR
jgi:hypothetical protein